MLVPTYAVPSADPGKITNKRINDRVESCATPYRHAKMPPLLAAAPNRGYIRAFLFEALMRKLFSFSCNEEGIGSWLQAF